jgi:hypothetical protein
MPGGTHNFVLTTFTKGEACDVCELLLWGMIHQGYLCTVCNTKIHVSCARKMGEQHRFGLCKDVCVWLSQHIFMNGLRTDALTAARQCT